MPNLPPVCVNKIPPENSQAPSLRIIYSCFHATTAELSTYDRDH